MTTDWMLIRRAAAELARALHGSRVTDMGLLDDGRIAVRFGGLKRPGPATLAVDAFGSPPLVTLEDAEMQLAVDPGWLRAAGTTARGTRLSEVRARRADRVVVLVLGTSSRFGVESESRLVLELVPRYGNVVLLRDRIVVAAAKQFSPAENSTRSVQVGLPYEPPPLPRPVLDEAGFARAIEAAPDADARARALGGLIPEVPRLVAASVVAQSESQGWSSAAALAAWLAERARAVLAEVDRRPDPMDPLYLYRGAGGALAAVHVLPLAQYAGSPCERIPSLLGAFAEARAASTHATRNDAAGRRRAALLVRIARRLRATEEESAALAVRAADAAARDRLRESGDALYTHVHDVPQGATSYVPPTNRALTIDLDPELDVHGNAQRYYLRYRKAADAVPHVERRREALAARREALETLAFEAERAEPQTLPELEADLDALEGRVPARQQGPATRKRAPLRLERPSGARIYVGRSPRENAEVTFRIARPDDLWFHARGIPGSHVVLQPPPGARAGDDDLEAAADLAAAHSKARNAARVEVDYTERKYVRKQRDAGPGLVWYTNARTRVGRPTSA